MVKNPPSNAGDVGSSPGRGTKIPYAVCRKEKIPSAATKDLAQPNK